MPETRLDGRSVLVLEDEYLMAEELSIGLGDCGANVLGPIATVEGALDLIKLNERIDCAVLDVNLGGEWAYPAADALMQREVPFLFTTGYDSSVIPSRFAHVVCCRKPISITRIVEAVTKIVHP